MKTRQRSGAAAFTLIEMMTAIALLILVIVAVGIIFQSATRSVGLSQVTLETMSNVRAVQSQIERDVSGIDRGGFIVIRSRDGGSGRRWDQICFIANGHFQNRTGIKTNAPFTDRMYGNAARVWYGHVAVEGLSVPSTGNYISPANQNQSLGMNAPPSGVNDADFILGRQAMLLVSRDRDNSNMVQNSGSSVTTFSDIRWNTSIGTADMPDLPAGGTNEPGTHITASRIGVAAITPGELMRSIQFAVGTRSGATQYYERENFCYRLKVLTSVYQTEVNDIDGVTPSFTNAYFRMHPIMLPAVPSFAVDWTDGSLHTGTSIDPATGSAGIANTTRWYGLGAPMYGSGTDATEPDPQTGTTGDGYNAIFSFDNPGKWPKALRFRYRVTDSADRLNGGRDFVQVMRLPD